MKHFRLSSPIAQFFPILTWLPNYQRDWLWADITSYRRWIGCPPCFKDSLNPHKILTNSAPTQPDEIGEG